MSLTSLSRLGAFGLALAIGLLTTAGSEAAPLKAPVGRTVVAKVAVAKAPVGKIDRGPASAVAPGVTWTSSEPEAANCGRSRRKLWQAGEGWVVKSVTVCR